jgi:hypothetical protein
MNQQAAVLASFGYQRNSPTAWMKPVGYTLLVIDLAARTMTQWYFAKDRALNVWKTTVLETDTPDALADSIRRAEHWGLKLDAGTEPPEFTNEFFLNPDNTEYVINMRYEL